MNGGCSGEQRLLRPVDELPVGAADSLCVGRVVRHRGSGPGVSAGGRGPGLLHRGLGMRVGAANGSAVRLDPMAPPPDPAPIAAFSGPIAPPLGPGPAAGHSFLHTQTGSCH